MNIYKNQWSFFKYLIFLLWRYSFMSLSAGCWVFLWFYAFWCWINFFNSFILISFSLSSFYFSFRINNFFSSSSLRCWSYFSILWIFYCQLFSASFRSFSNSLIWSSTSAIIYTVTILLCGPFLAFFFPSSILCSISLILDCFVMYCSWFLRSIRSFYNSFSDKTLHSYFSFDSCSLSLETFYSYYPSFLITFNALFCSFFILKSPYFSLWRAFNYFCKAFN